jgi:hypothetical protein
MDNSSLATALALFMLQMMQVSVIGEGRTSFIYYVGLIMHWRGFSFGGYV